MKNPPSRSHILIADDHPFFRSGLVSYIQKQPQFVCTEVGTAPDLLRTIAQHVPDLLLLDLRLGSADGLELIKSLHEQHSNLPILIISQSNESIYGPRALRAGARGYIMKEAAPEEVLTAIETVLRGEIYASRALAMMALRKTIAERHRSGAEKITDVLSDRELEVFERVGFGRSTREIAAELNLSSKTIETHRENIKHKLALHNAAELKKAAADWVYDGRGRR